MARNKKKKTIRKLWGVQAEFDRSSTPPGYVKLNMLYTSWNIGNVQNYEGEPTRPLLFTTKKAAQKWIGEAKLRFTGGVTFKAIRVEFLLLFRRAGGRRQGERSRGRGREEA